MTKALATVIFLLAATQPAIAQYKCVKNGTTVFQDSPCAGSVRRSADMAQPISGNEQRSAVAKPAVESADKSSQQTDLERQKTFMAKGAKDRKIADLQYEITRTESAITQLQSAMHAELADLEGRRSLANNNLAGATYLNSLANERQAVTARYDIDINTQRDRVKQLREELAAAQKP